MENQEPEAPSKESEPDLRSAPDPDLIRTIEESDMPESADPSLMRRIELEDPTEPVRVYIEETGDDE